MSCKHKLLIKNLARLSTVLQEFMGRQLLAMNVMWKYREQVRVATFDYLIFEPSHTPSDTSLKQMHSRIHIHTDRMRCS